MPEGSYENQENGGGLLSLLEAYGYADPGLSQANRAYLQRRQFGWNFRFRNNDDVLSYQIEWLTNAYFHSIYDPNINKENQKLSFRWLLLQALPDGGSINYNSPSSTTLASISYQGAVELSDPQLLWLFGRSLDYLEKTGGYLNALPGAERPINTMIATSPSVGSCLIFADSGLPNQRGALAPDKIVFRDGWEPDSAYLLINLRFTGWHRYKAINTISLLYQKEPLISEQIPYEENSLLPRGRSILRDKRIPRENLNGLIVERVGLDKTIQSVTQIGSQWAQDPPGYAMVKDFIAHPQYAYANIIVPQWNGWIQESEVYLYPGNALIILNKAQTSTNVKAANHYFYIKKGTSILNTYTLSETQITPVTGSLSEILQTEINNKLKLLTILPLGQWNQAKMHITPFYNADKLNLKINGENWIIINTHP